MATSLTGTFEATGVSAILQVPAGQSANIVLTNTGGNTWRVDLEQMTEGDQGAARLATYSSDTTGTQITNTTNRPMRLRLRCVTLDVDDGDTVAYTLQDATASATISQSSAKTVLCVGPAKAGATAGWVVAGATDVGKLATLPKAITAGTLVVRLTPLSVGDRIVGAYVLGSLQATTANHTTLALDIRSLTSGAAGATDARVALSSTKDVTANRALTSADTAVTIDHTVTAGETLYALITATTADNNACTADVLAVVVQVIPA